MDKSKDIDMNVKGGLQFTDNYAHLKNAATNARLFCVMAFVANIVAMWGGWGAMYGRLAALAAAAVGISVVVDGLPGGRLRTALSILSYALAAVSLGFFLFNIG